MSTYTAGKVVLEANSAAVVTNDVTIINWTATNSTFTPTRVDSGAANAPTGTVTFDAVDANAAANMQTAIRALGGIYATATVTAGVTADNMIITVFGGYDITWAFTGTGTVTETGAAGSDTATPGKVTYTGYIPVRGPFAEVKRIKLKGFVDNSLDVTITDGFVLPNGTPSGRTIFTATGLDTFTTNADTPIVKLLTADGVAGEDGAAASNTSGGVFDAPFKVVVATSSPLSVSSGTGSAALRRGIVELVIKTPYGTPAKRFLKRSTGAIATGVSSTVFNLGEEFVNVKRITISAQGPGTPDTTIAPTLTDADGFVVYTKTATDYTTAGGITAQLSHEGVDQANNAVADLLDVVVRSPITVTIAGGVTTGTVTVTTIVEA